MVRSPSTMPSNPCAKSATCSTTVGMITSAVDAACCTKSADALTRTSRARRLQPVMCPPLVLTSGVTCVPAKPAVRAERAVGRERQLVPSRGVSARTPRVASMMCDVPYVSPSIPSIPTEDFTERKTTTRDRRFFRVPTGPHCVPNAGLPNAGAVIHAAPNANRFRCRHRASCSQTATRRALWGTSKPMPCCQIAGTLSWIR